MAKVNQIIDKYGLAQDFSDFLKREEAELMWGKSTRRGAILDLSVIERDLAVVHEENLDTIMYHLDKTREEAEVLLKKHEINKLL